MNSFLSLGYDKTSSQTMGRPPLPKSPSPLAVAPTGISSTRHCRRKSLTKGRGFVYIHYADPLPPSRGNAISYSAQNDRFGPAVGF